MSAQAEALEALRGMIDALNNFAPVSVGELPANQGLSIALASGREGEATLALGRVLLLDVTLNARHANQRLALDTLCRIHETLARQAQLPGGVGWQMIAVKTGSSPGYLGRQNGQWLYGSALTVICAVD